MPVKGAFYLPTVPKVTHRMAATIGWGIDAMIPPNLPRYIRKLSQSVSRNQEVAKLG